MKGDTQSISNPGGPPDENNIEKEKIIISNNQNNGLLDITIQPGTDENLLMHKKDYKKSEKRFNILIIPQSLVPYQAAGELLYVLNKVAKTSGKTDNLLINPKIAEC
mgnify:CR=1 FL=1